MTSEDSLICPAQAGLAWGLAWEAGLGLGVLRIGVNVTLCPIFGPRCHNHDIPVECPAVLAASVP